MITKEEVLATTMSFYGYDPSRRASDGDICTYEDDRGENCAIGHFMTKKEIEELRMNGCSDYTASELEFEKYCQRLSHIDRDFLIGIQKLHDRCLNWRPQNKWLYEASNIIAHHNLDPAKVMDIYIKQMEANAIGEMTWEDLLEVVSDEVEAG